MWISGNVEIDEEVPTRILETAGNGIVLSKCCQVESVRAPVTFVN